MYVGQEVHAGQLTCIPKYNLFHNFQCTKLPRDPLWDLCKGVRSLDPSAKGKRTKVSKSRKRTLTQAETKGHNRSKPGSERANIQEVEGTKQACTLANKSARQKRGVA